MHCCYIPTRIAVPIIGTCVFECSNVRLASSDERRLACNTRKLSAFLSTLTEQVEKIQDSCDGTVFSFVATMEYKHKSEVVTQQETRRIRSEVLQEQNVVVLNLLIAGDVEIFRSAIPNIDYRCQVLHECITCNTAAACYAVATTKVEFVLIGLVSLVMSVAYRCFTTVVRKKIFIGSLGNAPTNLTQR
jgi:hypothetical protein